MPQWNGNEYDKDIEDHEYTPHFLRFEKRGQYPDRLLMGFEMEVDPKHDWERFCDKVRGLINKKEWLYAKEDGSVDGCEINTHPFNFNWFVSSRAMQGLGKLDSFAKASRNCGFHIHLSRNFFDYEHLVKMVYFFYGNPYFIESISQRDDMHFCNPSVEDYFTDEFGESKVTPESARKLVDGWNDDYGFERYMALNLCPDRTIEIRIFQGTINKKLIRAYLEFAAASAIYTKDIAISNVSVKGFKSFVKKNRKLFPMLIATNLLDGCVTKWSAVA